MARRIILEPSPSPGTVKDPFMGRAFVMDLPLAFSSLTVCALGLVILYSAADQNLPLLLRQGVRLSIAVLAFVGAAQVSPSTLRMWTPWIFLLGRGIAALGAGGRCGGQWRATLAGLGRHPVPAIGDPEARRTLDDRVVHARPRASAKFRQPGGARVHYRRTRAADSPPARSGHGRAGVRGGRSDRTSGRRQPARDRIFWGCSPWAWPRCCG